MLKLHDVSLKKFKDASGKIVPGLWESDIVRFERVGVMWECQIPCRAIGQSNYFEFRPVALGGHWMTIGTYRKRAGGCIAAEMLKAGTHLLRGGCMVEGEQMPRTIVALSAEITAEINRMCAP